MPRCRGWVSSAAPSNAYKSKDGAWVLVAGNSDPLFKALAGIMGQPELADDPRFRDNQVRCENVVELDRLIGAWVATQTAEEALEKLDQVNIPSSKIYTIADIAADEQYRERKAVTEVEDPHFGTVLHPGVVPVVNSALKLMLPLGLVAHAISTSSISAFTVGYTSMVLQSTAVQPSPLLTV